MKVDYNKQAIIGGMFGSNTSHFFVYTYNPPTIKSKQSPFVEKDDEGDFLWFQAMVKERNDGNPYIDEPKGIDRG